MLKDKITKSVASPSAEELIVQASDARAKLRSGHGAPGNVASEVQLPIEELGGFEVESKT